MLMRGEERVTERAVLNFLLVCLCLQEHSRREGEDSSEREREREREIFAGGAKKKKKRAMMMSQHRGALKKKGTRFSLNDRRRDTFKNAHACTQKDRE